VEDTLAIKEQLGVKVKDPRFTGSRKIKIEQIVGDDLHRNSGKWYKKVRIIDRENDRYYEEIVDPDTGNVIRQCDEPLSEHRGRGSEKGKDA
jgi:uncharacterized FlaG/YvyC family protein